MKRKLIFLVLYTCFVVAACKLPEPDINDLYIMETRVIDFKEESDLVITECETGKLYVFTGIEDWELNDRCVLLMEEDEILRTYYRR